MFLFGSSGRRSLQAFLGREPNETGLTTDETAVLVEIAQVRFEVDVYPLYALHLCQRDGFLYQVLADTMPAVLRMYGGIEDKGMSSPVPGQGLRTRSALPNSKRRHIPDCDPG